jgi:hypothetical protein
MMAFVVTQNRYGFMMFIEGFLSQTLPRVDSIRTTVP